MKRVTLIVLLFTGMLSYGQARSHIIREIDSYKKDIVSNAKYDNEYSEVWDAIFIIASKEYNTISRESESKGYIEANIETNTKKESLTMDIRGSEAPYRVSFQVKQERRVKKQDGSFSNWEAYVDYGLGNYYTKLQTRLYELLNGPLELPEELQQKIDDYNSSQTKDRRKIIKGKHY